MAYVVPTAADLIARYPAFAAVPEITINVHISDAAASGVDTSWAEGDYAPAIAALAAHTMSLVGLGAQSEAEGYARTGLTRIRSGNFDASFSEARVAAASGGGFNATMYGRQYYVLLRRNRGGPRIVTGAPLDVADIYPC